MTPIANVLTGLVALAHVGILVLEMFLWDHPVGRRIFAMTPEVSASSRVLAMNQGLYNGFLAAGLIWGLLAGRRDVKVFFLSCVVVAGVFGGITAKTSILLTQALPGLIALVCACWLRRAETASGADDPRDGVAAMPDIYVKVKEASPQILEGLMRALELRAADPQQRVMLNAYLTDAALPQGARLLLHESRGSQTRMKAQAGLRARWRRELTCRNT